MSFPTTSVLDNANRANTGPPLGGNWTVVYGMDAGFKISSNQIIPSASSANLGEYWNAGTFGADCEVYVTAATIDHASDYSATVFYIRTVTPNTSGIDGYSVEFIWRDAGATLDDIDVYRIDNNVETLLGSRILSSGWANGDVYGVSVVGNTITPYRNGSAFATRTDTTYSAAGYIGFGWYFNLEGTAKYDDFGGGTIVSLTTSEPALQGSARGMGNGMFRGMR